MTMLCGHTHGDGEAQVLPNLRVLTGGAIYGKPVIQWMLEVECAKRGARDIMRHTAQEKISVWTDLPKRSFTPRSFHADVLVAVAGRKARGRLLRGPGVPGSRARGPLR